MSDEPREPEAEAAESTRPNEDEGNDLREVSEDELKDILAAHKNWLESGGKDGKQADLSKADLHGIRLWSVDLRYAFLWKADLGGTSLKDANLQGCDLRRANLCGASFLEGVIIRDAQLQDANLLNVKGLLGHQLAGTNVSGAKLSGDIAEFKGLDHVTEISKHARNIFLAAIGGCVFSWLTIATTTDMALLTNTASTPLPIIQTKVPIAGFYFAAPLILLSLYIYLHMYLQRLWSSLAGLPAIFPDGRSLDERAYPWLLTSLVGANVPRLKEDRPPFSRQQVFLSILTAWCLVPLTIGWFWLRYLPVHYWIGTGVHIALVALAVTAGVGYFWRAQATLRGRQLPKFTWKIWRWRSPVPYAHGALFLGLAAAAFVVSDGAINGVPVWSHDHESAWGHRKLVPAAFDLVGFRPTLNIRQEDISIKTENWTGLRKKPDEWTPGDLAVVKGAQLAERDLRYADAAGAFLVRADLSGANLQGANLFRANLQGANLVSANLQGAKLRSAKLQEAKLFRTNLQGAFLVKANLRRAKLFGANLQKANLGSAKLQGADFSFADLRGAKGLKQEQFKNACGDENPRLPAYLKDYKLKPCPKESR